MVGKSVIAENERLQRGSMTNSAHTPLAGAGGPADANQRQLHAKGGNWVYNRQPLGNSRWKSLITAIVIPASAFLAR